MHNPPRVLVVDDDKNIRETIKMGLDLDYDVVTADGVETARAMLIAHQHDLVLLDIRLGGQSGLDLLTEIKGKAPEMPVIMLTAHANMEVVLEALRNQAYDFLEKPVQFEFLEAAIQRALDHRRLLEERREYTALLEKRNAELNAARQRMVAAENIALTGQLSQGLMHEINNPLSAIRTNVELMGLVGGMSESQKKYLQAVDIASQRISKVMQSLADIPFSQGDFRQIKAGELVREVILELKQIGYLTNCKQIQINIAPSLPTFEFSYHQIRQVVNNILLNAAESITRARLRECVILIDARRVGNMIQLSTFNEGPIIQPEEMAQLFKPGFTTKHTEGRIRGLGLGLYMARNLVEANGGQLEVANVDTPAHRGVRVTLVLPLKRKDPKDT
jgi:signal transduction histidine kinase